MAGTWARAEGFSEMPKYRFNPPLTLKGGVVVWLRAAVGGAAIGIALAAGAGTASIRRTVADLKIEMK
jgi:hypothetical protein